MSILNLGTQALEANLTALQTIGNNIANVNTPGYSRQRSILEAVQGQFTGGGYIGKGVAVSTIQRNFDVFLNQQATQASSVQAGDQIRADQLTSLENLFPGGSAGLGQAVNDMLNSFSDVASAPADMTARTVALTKVNETAARMRAASASLDAMQNGMTQSLTQMVTNINTIAGNIASVNTEIARAQGKGQPPNDLLDKRDQLIRDLNQLVQTTQVPASDGSISVFVGGSQALVLGSIAAHVALAQDTFGDPLKTKLTVSTSGSAPLPLDENALGGGQVSGMLKFQNTDLNNARNLLGRLTLAITAAMNQQHQLGLDMDGKPGGPLFTPISFGAQNILPALSGNSSATLGLSISDLTKLEASDYQIDFTGSASGTITRLSDGVVTSFPQTPPASAPALATLDGLNINLGTGTPAAGDSFLIKPFNTAASNVESQFATPRSLAVSSPVAVSAGASNKGSLTVTSLLATNLATPINNYSISFSTGAGGTSYNIIDTSAAPPVTVDTQPYVPGQAIIYPAASVTGIPGFSLTLTGAPANGDSMSIKANPYAAQDGGNASAIMALRDLAMFDGAALSDGYASAIAQIGIVSQSASYSAQVAGNLANSAKSAATAVSGVNLDEEAAQLLQYQQAYQASSKMIQIAQTIFQNLLQGLT